MNRKEDAMFKKIWLLLGSIFFGVGLLLGVVAAGIFLFTATNRNRIMNDSAPVTAVIVDITRSTTRDGDMRNTAYIEYEFDDEIYFAPLRWWSSGMRVGQPIEIYVNRQDPYQFITDGIIAWLPVIILSPMALLFGGLGAGFLIYHACKKKRHRWLLDFGTPVWANVEGFEENWRIQVNGRPATVLVASYNNMRFVSSPLDNNDRAHIGEHVKVLIHPEDNNKYTFDFANESYLMPSEPPALSGKSLLQ